MTAVDRSRIGKLVAAAASVQLASLTPADPVQARQDQVRRLVADAVRLSDKRAVLVVLVEQ